MSNLLTVTSIFSFPSDESSSNKSIHSFYLQTPKDSLNKKLYELIASSNKINDSITIREIEILITKGADPNASITLEGSYRKLGSYIPIVKHFYRNRYRNYTYHSTAFHTAVGKGNIKITQKLLELGAKINTPTDKDNYPITVAILADDMKMIDFLLNNGADINTVDLSYSKNVDLIEKLVEKGANPKYIDINFALDNKDVLKKLLALQPDLQNSKLNFETLFTDDELLDLLLADGLSIKATGIFPDECPLVYGAIKYNNIKALKKLIALGANKSEKCNLGFGETPLLSAIYYENINIIAYLLSVGVSPNEKEWTDKSALLNAVETNNDKIINLLIDAGADIEYDKYFGKTPIMQASEWKNYIAVQTLINRGANVNHKTKYGETSLHIAIDENDYPIIKLLVESGANIHVKYDGMTLVEYAKDQKASPMIVEYLSSL